MPRRGLFVRPALEAFKADPEQTYVGRFLTYSHYNYLRPGPIAWVKRSRFETALKLAQPHFSKDCGAIDMGCADGILLPSLSRYFGRAVGTDFEAMALRSAANLVDSLGLTNVELVNNKGLSLDELRERLGNGRYHVMFVLETLEHVGRSPATMYDDRIAFLDEQFELLEPGGVIIISVPKMVGPAFLVKYAVQYTLRMHRERLSAGEIWQSGVMCDASNIEHRWANGHIGFDQTKLDRLISQRYEVLERRNQAVTLIWKIRKRT